MNRRLFRKWALWLLPLLAVRAFIPAGFMLTADTGGLHLEFCPAQSPGLVQALAAVRAADHAASLEDPSTAHAQHHHLQGDGIAPEHAGHHLAGQHSEAQHPGMHHAGGSEHASPLCPYALAAVAIALHVPHLEAEFLRPANEPIEPRRVFTPSAGPLRADPIRGPPALS